MRARAMRLPLQVASKNAERRSVSLTCITLQKSREASVISVEERVENENEKMEKKESRRLRVVSRR